MSRGVVVSMSKYQDAYNWCVDTFSDDNDFSWYVDYQLYLDPEFVFTQDSDAELFLLRWG